MRNRILRKKLFLTTTSICITALCASAQVNSTKQDDYTINVDSLVKNKISLPFGVTARPAVSTASTQAIYTPTIVKQPVTNITNTLTGRIAGLYSQQNSGQPGLNLVTTALNAQQSIGQPGFDAAALTLRGRTPIILVDGIPRPLTTIDLEEVESVTVLKDAMATAMLGVRGANGAILITTRQGSASKQVISFTAQSAFQQPLGMPKALSAFDYATLRNEAINNGGSGTLYSAADLQAYRDHTDPIGHPDIDWRKQILKSTAQFTRYSLNVGGGSSSVKYFVALEHFDQGGLLKTSSANTYNTNENLSSYSIRSNVDINLTQNLTAGIHLYGRILNDNQPGATTATLFNSFLTTPNNAYPVLNANGTFAGTPQYSQNIQGQATGSGYQQNYTRDILADFYLKRTLDKILPGLYFKAVVSYASNLNQNLNRSKPVVAYQAFSSATGGATTYGNALTTPSDQLNVNTVSNISGTPNQGQSRQNYLEASFGYNRSFNSKHNLDVVVLGNRDSYYFGNNIPYIVSGFSGKASYNFKEKYIAEVAAAYNGSDYYPTVSHTKYGFFPVVGLGWNITKEDFMKGYSWLNNLKLSANYGKVGNDNPGYFAYIQRIFDGTQPYFGVSPGATATLAESTLANPNITFEKAKKLNVNLQGALLNSRLGFSVDYYRNNFYDLLIQRGKSTALIGNFYPNENVGKNLYTGFDFQLSWQKPKTKDLSYYVALNAGLQQSKVQFSDEVNQPYAYLQRTGQKVGQQYGYVAAGLFQNQADIANAKQNGVAVLTGYVPQPGDIKYKDLNGDGVINQFDQTAIGPKGPLTTLGADLGFSYKSFDFSALVQGVVNYSVYLSGNSYWEFQNNGFGQAYQQQLGRFTPATAATATYPRLSIGGNVNNQNFSTYWYRRADYLRLKNAEIGFTLPSRYANAVQLKSVRIFANGLNLLTATKLKGGLDPEVYNGSYPLQRLYNLGINVKL